MSEILRGETVENIEERHNRLYCQNVQLLFEWLGECIHNSWSI